MTTGLKKFEGQPTCGSLVRGHDEEQPIAFSLEHLKKEHAVIVAAEEPRG